VKSYLSIISLAVFKKIWSETPTYVYVQDRIAFLYSKKGFAEHLPCDKILPFLCGLVVSAHASKSSGPGSNPGWRQYVEFLDKTLYSHSASIHPDVLMGTGEFLAGGNPAMECNRIQGGREILIVA